MNNYQPEPNTNIASLLQLLIITDIMLYIVKDNYPMFLA